MFRLIALTVALLISTTSGVTVTGVTTLAYNNASKGGSVAVGTAGIVITHKFATTTAKIVTFTLNRLGIDTVGLAKANVSVKYHATTCASAVTAVGTAQGEPEDAANIIVTASTSSANGTIVVPAATAHVFTAASCIVLEINAVAKLASKACDAGTVVVTGSTTHSTSTDAGGLTVTADSPGPQVQLVSTGTGNACKLCANTAGGTIATGTCYCAAATPASMVSTSGAVCESTSAQAKKCTKTAGAATTADTYVCANAAAASGTFGVTLATSVMLLGFASKRFFTSFA